MRDCGNVRFASHRYLVHLSGISACSLSFCSSEILGVSQKHLGTVRPSLLNFQAGPALVVHVGIRLVQTSRISAGVARGARDRPGSCFEASRRVGRNVVKNAKEDWRWERQVCRDVTRDRSPEGFVPDTHLRCAGSEEGRSIPNRQFSPEYRRACRCSTRATHDLITWEFITNNPSSATATILLHILAIGQMGGSRSAAVSPFGRKIQYRELLEENEGR